MSGQPRSPSSDSPTDFAVAFAGMLALFGILPSGEIDRRRKDAADETPTAPASPPRARAPSAFRRE
jgi:hypothetical protein